MILILHMRQLRHRKIKGLSHTTVQYELSPRSGRLLSPLALSPAPHCPTENDKRPRLLCAL